MNFMQLPSVIPWGLGDAVSGVINSGGAFVFPNDLDLDDDDEEEEGDLDGVHG